MGFSNRGLMDSKETTSLTVRVVGAGLAGCEAAWQLAQRGFAVTLVEMKLPDGDGPGRRTEAQRSDFLAELVCSNSLRSRNVRNAVGLLKREMAQLSSLVIRQALAAQVPAGDALAVDRERFGLGITAAMQEHPGITVVGQEVTALPDDGVPTLIATGPLTAGPLAQAIGAATGRDRLYFYDALAPIVRADSLDRDVVFAASRYGKGDGDDYLNCPLDKAQYQAFWHALIAAECSPLHAFESAKYFEGCLPIEVLAQRGPDTLRFGPMKPVGLTDPRTGRRPWAVVQLRKEDVHGQAYNLVGFQTKMKIPEQRRMLQMLPGLEQVAVLRYGAVHRNTYLDSPQVLDARMGLRTEGPWPSLLLRFAGQITGVEGYVESAAHGLMTSLLWAADLRGEPLEPPPGTTAMGALWGHVTGAVRAEGRRKGGHEPHNVHWGMVPPVPGVRKHEAKEARVQRAMSQFEHWANASGLSLQPVGT